MNVCLWTASTYSSVNWHVRVERNEQIYQIHNSYTLGTYYENVCLMNKVNKSLSFSLTFLFNLADMSSSGLVLLGYWNIKIY